MTNPIYLIARVGEHAWIGQLGTVGCPAVGYSLSRAIASTVADCGWQLDGWRCLVVLPRLRPISGISILRKESCAGLFKLCNKRKSMIEVNNDCLLFI